MSERFERYHHVWKTEEIHKLHLLAGNVMSLKAIAKSLLRS